MMQHTFQQCMIIFYVIAGTIFQIIQTDGKLDLFPEVMKSQKDFNLTPVQEIWINEGDQIMAFMRGDLLYVFNFSPTRSYTDYGFLVPLGEYNVVLNTDSPDYGGFGFSDDSVAHFTNFDPMYAGDGKGWLQLYIPARSAVVLKKV